MNKIFLALPLVAIISACVTTQTTDTNTTQSNTNFDSSWTSNLVEQKAALRSCILANKDIQSILYLDQSADTTVLTVNTKNGVILDCSVNPATNQVTKITPRTENRPINVSKFYPVGKRLPDVCRGNESLRDEENRLMGTICY